MRLDTAPFKPEDDWTGFFIRGDCIPEFAWPYEVLWKQYMDAGKPDSAAIMERLILRMYEAWEGEVGVKHREYLRVKFAAAHKAALAAKAG